MSKPLFVFVLVLFIVLGGWMAYQYEADDPGGRAKLESWAAGLRASTSSETAGYSCELSAAVEAGTDWVLHLSVQARADGHSDPAKKPVRFLVEVNEHSSSVGAGPDGRYTIRVPLSAFRLNERPNHIRTLVVSQDGTDFGGWAFGNITFREDGVGLAKPTWFERLLD